MPIKRVEAIYAEPEEFIQVLQPRKLEIDLEREHMRAPKLGFNGLSTPQHQPLVQARKGP